MPPAPLVPGVAHLLVAGVPGVDAVGTDIGEGDRAHVHESHVFARGLLGLDHGGDARVVLGRRRLHVGQGGRDEIADQEGHSRVVGQDAVDERAEPVRRGGHLVVLDEVVRAHHQRDHVRLVCGQRRVGETGDLVDPQPRVALVVGVGHRPVAYRPDEVEPVPLTGQVVPQRAPVAVARTAVGAVGERRAQRFQAQADRLDGRGPDGRSGGAGGGRSSVGHRLSRRSRAQAPGPAHHGDQRQRGGHDRSLHERPSPSGSSAGPARRPPSEAAAQDSSCGVRRRRG